MALYFAYGSNLDRRQMKRRCPSSELVGVGRLEGYRVGFPRYSTKRKGGVAGIERSDGDCVWGALYEVVAEDVDSLDKQEGVPYAYMRAEELQVALPDGSVKPAFTYIANKTGVFRPHRSYLQQIIRAAGELGLPQDYIETLKTIPYQKGT